MKRRPYLTWFWILLALVFGGGAIAALIYVAGSVTMAQVVAGVFNLAVLGWMLYGIWKWWEYRWVRALGTILITGTIAGVVASVNQLVSDDLRAMYAALGAWVMISLAVLGLELIKLILRPGWATFGVARTFISEATSNRFFFGAVIACFLAVSAMPLIIHSNERLSYQIQFFLTFSTIITFLGLGTLTVVLTCWSVCHEIKAHQIYMTMTKPISRHHYLLGKWLGMVLLNAVFVTVSGVGIYSTARVMQQAPVSYADIDAQREAEMDKALIEREVLTARASVFPNGPDSDYIRARVEALREALAADSRSGTFGEVAPSYRSDAVKDIVVDYFTIAPSKDMYIERMNPESGEREMRLNPRAIQGKNFEFEGLSDAKRDVEAITLRIKPRATNPPTDDRLQLELVANGASTGPTNMAHNKFYRYNLPTSVIDSEGKLVLGIGNWQQDSGIRFAPDEGLELLYQTGTFEGNLARGMFIIWLQLCFLAALGVASATFMSFPIASMFALMVFGCAAFSGFILESLQNYASMGVSDDAGIGENVSTFFSRMGQAISEGETGDFFKGLLRAIGQLFMFVVPSFSDINPTNYLNDGRAIPVEMLIGDWADFMTYLTRPQPEIGAAFGALWRGAILRIAVWCGLVGFLGWVLFRSRELARVTV